MSLALAILAVPVEYVPYALLAIGGGAGNARLVVMVQSRDSADFGVLGRYDLYKAGASPSELVIRGMTWRTC